MKFNSIKFALLLFLFSSCVNDTQTDIEEQLCETVFTYNDCVKAIIDANCVTCHNSGANPIGPFPLETFIQVKNSATLGGMLERIQRPDGADGIMPATGKMVQSNIDVIVNWANNGYMQ